MKKISFVPPMLLCLLAFPACIQEPRTSASNESAARQTKTKPDPDAAGKTPEKASDAEEFARRELEAKEKYQLARDLARNGEFEKAEKFLDDLTAHFPETSGGSMARDYTKYDFPIMKATRLIEDAKLGRAEAVLRDLQKKKDLTQDQMADVERMLDSVSLVTHAVSISRLATLQKDCRAIQVYLETYYAENGQYPENLTLESLCSDQWAGLARLKGTISGIEQYQTSGPTFSFIVVGKQEKTQIKVTQFEIKKVK